MATSNQVAPEKSSSHALEEERREFEAVAAALTNSSRLLRLITYLGEKYFGGDADQLQEYNIATEVFGRSRTTFNPGEDAIVRVEFHRLRKRLREYYEAEGKDHPIQLTVPPGTYSPVFVRRQPLAETQPPNHEVPEAPVFAPLAPSLPPGRRRWPYLLTIGVLVFAAVALYLTFRSQRNGRERASAAVPSPAATPPSASTAFASVPLRILAGYSGKPQMDSAGQIWEPDQYFQSGGNWHVSADYVANSTNPMLFEHWRNGQFSYNVPLRPGTYELHLYFMALDRGLNSPPTFSVSMNGDLLLPDFDIYSDTMGTYVADERVFRDVHPEPDGFLHLDFTGGRSTATLNAIEILPGIPHHQVPVRLVMQSRPVTDHSGRLWHPDDDYQGGYASVKNVTVSGTADPDLFTAERYGHFSYSIPVDTRDRYTLVLYFAELYFGPNASGTGGVGSRVFRVLCNGNTLLDNFDIYKEAGSLHAITKTFYHLKPTAQGKLNITFEPIVNYATVSAIEVLDESQ
ncbi:MAG TPA: malectin domain-containing carbohydrate-binding protein [Pseudacidobacterium sp.]|nr:malectin domain-containing carbohydrate-binding protein [Pseudacidobacterium sp.]